jgi:phage terminase small subunit
LLTPKQKAFADEYIKCGNATEAARKAGYSEKAARQIATENLSKPSISEYIRQRMEQMDAQRVASADEVMRFFSSVMRGEVMDQFGLEASLDTRLSAGKELMRRYNAVKNDDGRIDRVAQIMARLDAEAEADTDAQ